MNLPKIDIIELFKATPGAISVCEMVAIYNIASQAPQGSTFETGSHAGKSSIAASCGFNGRRTHHLIDPCYDLSNREAWKHACQESPENMPWAYVNDVDFCDKVCNRVLQASNGNVSPHLMGDYSLHAIPLIQDNIAYAFLDSDQHQYELVKAECELIRNRMAVGGIIAFHDFRNQYVGPQQVYNELLATGEWQEVAVPASEIRAFVSSIGGENGNNTWHAVGVDLPLFVGAIRKI